MEENKKSSSFRKNLLYLIFTLITIVVILFYIFINIPADTFFQIITNFIWSWFILTFIDLLFCMLLRGLRLRFLLKEFNEGVTYRDCLFSIFGGYYINTISPARLGDVYNAYVLNKSSNVNLGHSVGSIVISRIMDIVILVIFALTTIFYHIFFGKSIFVGFTPSVLQYLQPVFIIIIVITVSFVLILIFKNKFLILLNKILGRLPIIKKMERKESIEKLSKDSINTIEYFLKNKKLFLIIILFTFGIVFLDTLTIFCMTRAINFPFTSLRFFANDLYHNMPLYLTIMTGSMALLSLSFVVLPGGIGQYELVGAIILENIVGLALIPWGFTGFTFMFIEHLLVRAAFFSVGGNISLYKLGKPGKVLEELND